MKPTPSALFEAFGFFAKEALWPIIRHPRRMLSSSNPEQPVYVFLLVLLGLLIAPGLVALAMLAIGHPITLDHGLRLLAWFFGVLWGFVLLAWWMWSEIGPPGGGGEAEPIQDEDNRQREAAPRAKLRVVPKKRDAA